MKIFWPTHAHTVSHHPVYGEMERLWRDWRMGYEGGERFIEEFLMFFSNREDPVQYAERRRIAYLPAFAKEGINDIKNAIFQRTSDVTREGGSKAYQEAVNGGDGGIDFRGSTMGSFMGRKILAELLVLAKVGIYVDNSELEGDTLSANIGKRPYIYHYTAENILNWKLARRNNGTDVEFTALLLRDWAFKEDEETGLAGDRIQMFRHLRLIDEKVQVTWFSDIDLTINGTKIDKGETIREATLDIPRIPFVLMEISESLMKDIVRYQASLLNLASSDVYQLTNANFPFLTEQYDPRFASLFLKGERGVSDDGAAGFNQHDDDVKDDPEPNPGVKKEEELIGPTQGKLYPKGMERPQFIHPSSETVVASMDKQNIMKQEIRELLSLSLSNIQPRMASAEAKQLDERGLESGLSAIALELEQGERMVARMFSMYENGTAATIKYPERYALQSGADRREEIKDLASTLKDCPSVKGRKEIQKKMIELAIGNRLSDTKLEEILQEIDAADFMTGDPEIITVAVENQLVSPDIAARALGLPGGDDIKKAEEAHASRAARVAKAQASIKTEPRGAGDLQSDPNAQKTGDADNAQ